MKVRELIEALSSLPPEAEVILQKDSEGNGYSPLDSVGTGWYVAKTTWGGDFYHSAWEADDFGMEEEEYEALKKKKPQAVVLVPTN